MNKNYININVESLDDATLKTNFKGGASSYDDLIQLGSGLLQTFLSSAAQMIKRNDDELDMPDPILQLTILDALVDKIGTLIQMNKEDKDNDKKVDQFLNSLLNGLKGDE